MEPPDTHYVKNGDVHIAHQVLGEGPPDLVLVAGIYTNVDYQWDDPSYAAFPIARAAIRPIPNGFPIPSRAPPGSSCTS